MRINELSDINLPEARNPKYHYTVEEAKGELDRVTVNVTNQKGSAWTKLGNELKSVRNKLNELGKKEKEISGKIKDQFPEMFDATDEVLTRVVETASIIATMSKPGTGSRTTVDYNKIIAAILKLNLLPEQQKAITAIIDAHTETTESNVPSKLTIRLKESVVDKISSLWNSLLTKVKRWGRKQDIKLEKVRSYFPKQALNEEAVLSSWIEDLSYSAPEDGSGEGDVEMTLNNGRAYVFYNVPYSVYEEWVTYPSKGQYYHNYMKGNYEVR